jgi:hypothetical protein
MWKHVIIDDFLSKEHFDYCVKTFDTNLDDPAVLDKSTRKGKKSVAHTYAFKNGGIKQKSKFVGNIKTDKFSEQTLLEMHNIYTPKLLEILKELAPEKVKDYDHALMIFTLSPKDSVYGKHTDIQDKLLSTVIYLKPENNTGTILYEHINDPNPQTVEWKQNRALIFSRTDETWHSYEGDKINDRYVLVYNLMSAR